MTSTQSHDFQTTAWINRLKKRLALADYYQEVERERQRDKDRRKRYNRLMEVQEHAKTIALPLLRLQEPQAVRQRPVVLPMRRLQAVPRPR